MSGNWAIPLAIAAAACYAVGSVLEQYEAAKQPEDKALEVGLVLDLVRRPLWILGLVLDMGGFVFQAWALALGNVAIVQVLLATAILMALPLGVKYTGQRLGPREWTGAAIVSAGIALFMVFANIDKGSPTTVLGREWLIVTGIVVVIAAVGLVGGWRTSGAARAALWGTVAGVAWGIMSVYLDTTMALWDQSGFWSMLATPYPYAVLVSGGLGLIVVQSAFQTGKLAPSMATFESLQPFTAVILGVYLFGQRLHGDVVVREIGAALGLAVLIVGIVVLSGSKVVAAGAGALDPDDELLEKNVDGAGSSKRSVDPR